MAKASTSTHPHSGFSKKDTALIIWADNASPGDSPLIHWPRKLVRILLICLREIQENVLTLRAGYLTYAILLSMVPMLAMSTAVVKGLGGGDQLREVVYSYVDSLEKKSPKVDEQSKPTLETSPQIDSTTGEAEQPVDLTGHLSSAIDKIFDYVDRTNFATLGTFGMVGIFLSVILVLGQVEKSLNVIWKVDNGRSFLRKVTDYIALMIMMPFALNVAIAAGALLKSQALNVHVDRYLPIDWIQTVLLEGIPILVLSLTLYMMYIFFPNKKTGGLATMIGAVIAGTCWFITQNVYISMQIGVAKYNAIYGSFATIPLFLAWVWLGWLFVLIGAQVAYAIQAEPRYHFITKTPRPVLQISAALDICSMISRRFSDMQPTYIDNLIEKCPEYEPELLRNVLGALVKNNILHYTREDDEIMPSRPPEFLSNRKVVETVLGKNLPDTEGGRSTLQAMKGVIDAVPENEPPENGPSSEPEEMVNVGRPEEDDTSEDIREAEKKQNI